MPRGIHGHHVHADSLGETTRRRAFSDQPLRRCSRELLPTPLNFASSISPWTQDFAIGNMRRRSTKCGKAFSPGRDRKSTRLNSSHGYISYAVFCLKKK